MKQWIHTVNSISEASLKYAYPLLNRDIKFILGGSKYIHIYRYIYKVDCCSISHI